MDTKQTDNKVVQELVTKALTDAQFQKALRQNPMETLSKMNLSPELRDSIVKALKEKSTSAQDIVTRLSAQFGANTAGG